MQVESINEVPGSSDQTQVTPDNSGGEPKVNAGAIRKSTTQSILKAAQAASGMEFESVEAMMSALARLSAQNNPVAPSKPVEEPKSTRAGNTDLQEQFMALKQDLTRKEQALRERELESEIRSVMGDKFDADLLDYALTKVKGNIQWEDGAYAIVNSKGQVRYGDDGNPMTIKGLVDEVARGNPKLLRSTMQSTGSGLRPSVGMFGGDSESIPDYATNPDAFNAWAAKNGLGKGQGLKTVRASVSIQNQSKRVI
jgi:hypothetical protein